MRRQQAACAGRQAAVPGGQRMEALLGLGAVPDLGIQGEQAQASAGGQFVPLVGIGQAAHGGGVQHAHAGWHQVQQAVQHLQARCAAAGLAQPLQARGAHQAQPGRAGPFLLERPLAAGMHLAQADARARQVLPHRPCATTPGQPRRKRLPQRGLVAVADADPGARPGVLPAQVDAVDRLVGQEGALGIAPPGGERSIAGQEGPQVAVAGQRHEERRRAVGVVDAVPGLAVGFHESACQNRRSLSCGGHAASLGGVGRIRPRGRQRCRRWTVPARLRPPAQQEAHPARQGRRFAATRMRETML